MTKGHPSLLWTIAWSLALQLPSNCKVAVALSSNNSYLDSLKPTSSASFGNSRQDEFDSMEDVIARTPEDHYAKHHPGAGWAGYKHPMYGGYLDHLSSSSSSSSSGESKATSASYLESLRENTWEQGKAADDGNDIRWGAQVYLNGL